MTRSEKKTLISNIYRTTISCYLILNNHKTSDFDYVGCRHTEDMRRELRRISSDLNCDTTPDYKLTAYSNRTLEILAELLSAQMTVQEIKNQ
jgi:hypothetical protein